MFVMEVDKGQENEAIVAAISRMAKSLDIQLVAEGIENENQLNEMLILGVQSGQGYLFSKPLPETELLELIHQNVSSFEEDKEGVYFIVYASQSDSAVDDKEIQIILKQSQASNRMNRITGYLVYDQGIFVQYIEGPKSNVKKLYEKISQDLRHHSVTLLAEGASDKRLFIGWTMGYQKLNRNNLVRLAGYDREMKNMFEKYINNPELCLSFFELMSKAI
jgi:hypothetical protein